MRGFKATTNKTWLTAFLGLMAVTICAPLSNTAQAQDTAVLEEIIVTAQRREENLQDVPMSVSSSSGERLTALFEGGEDIRALATRLPGLYAESSNGRLAPRFYLRGLGNTDFDLAASQAVSLLFDEVVQENVILKSFPLFDIDRVEVLRGPQGTLFGRNTTAGIIKFDTRKPTDDLEGYALASAGSLGTFNVEAAVGGALNDDGTIMGRISILSQHRDDWIDNAFTGVSDVMGGFRENAWRAQLLLEPSDNFSALVSVHGRDYDGTASIFRANVLTAGSNDFNSNYDRDTVFFDEGNNNPQEAEAYGGLLRLEFEMENGITLTSITAYETVENSSEGDIDGGNAVFGPGSGPGAFPCPCHTADGLLDLDQVTQELRFSGEGDNGFFWQTGLFIFDTEFTVFTNHFFIPISEVTQSNTAWALFGQVSMPLTDRLTLVGGVRYTDDEKDFSAFNTPLPTPDVSVEDDEVSADISAIFAVNEDLNLYGRIARGFRAPSIQGRDVALFAPTSIATSETIMSYELGIKATLADDRVRLNAAIYHYVIDDIQLTAIGGAMNLVQLVNAEEGTGTGFDIDAEFLISENFLVTAGFSISDTEIKDPNLTITPCGSGQCTVLNPLDGNGDAIVNGNAFPGAPDQTFNITLRYSIPIGTGELFFFTDWAQQGKTQFLLYETAEYSSDDNFEGGIRVGYVHGDNDWEIAVFGRNITDEENLKGGIDFNNNTGFDNEPSVWGVTFRKNFGNY